MTSVRSFTRGAGVFVALIASAGVAPAQVKYPAPPERYDVQIRYRIQAGRDERVRQFRALEDYLGRLGFDRKRFPDDELDIFDPAAERFEGTVPAKNALPILADPRVRTILFRPVGYALPDDAAKPVPVRIWTATGYLPAEQQRLHRQVVAQLARLGFREAVGYSTVGSTIVRGDLPAGNVPRLLKDLRTEPAGWFLSDTPAAALPSPLRETLPVRAVEVLADADLEPFVPQPVPANRVRLTPDLRSLLGDAAAAARPLRVEAVMDHRPEAGELDSLRSRLRSAYARPAANAAAPRLVSGSLEGVVGPVVTVSLPQAADAERLALEPGVVVVRLPRAAVETVGPLPAGGKATAAADVLAATRVAAFHDRGYRGQGTRVVVIATDFPGLGAAGDVRYLDDTRTVPVTFLDLTAELSPDLLPAAPAANPSAAGTAAARAAHLAAPAAALVLVRVDPAAFFQVYEVARSAAGTPGYTEAMQSRFYELSLRADELQRRRVDVVEEYRRAFESLSDDDEPRQRRERARAAFDALTRAETASALAIGRAVALQNATRALDGATAVVNTLVWESGFAHDGLSDLSQLIDTAFASEAITAPLTRSATRPRPPARPVWVQAASPSAGAVWAGAFLDADGNGVMEFTDPARPLPVGEWTRELSFLGVRQPGATTDATLPAGARVRLTTQWRETHDPSGYGGRDAIFPLTLRVFQQLDPEGKARASDELKEVARSDGGPYLVRVEPGYGVYEQAVEFTVPAAGRYCVMVEGQTVFDPRLPALRRQIEVTPRMVVEFVGAPAGTGRAVFTEYAPRTAGVAIPGDSKAAVTVGTVDGQGTALAGGGPGVTLLSKPDLIADGSIDVGTGQTAGTAVSAGFAGGVLAGLVGSGAPPGTVIRATGLQTGGPAMIPEGWLRVVPPRRR